MGVYGSADTANSANVNFAFDLALQAARDLYSLHTAVDTAQGTRSSAAAKARPDWSGHNRDLFETKVNTESSDSATISGSLVKLANLFAESWAKARGEQDRINTARYVKHQQDSENWAEKGADSLFGATDYGAPPSDPAVPSSPEYAPTRSPMHPEFEHA